MKNILMLVLATIVSLLSSCAVPTPDGGHIVIGGGGYGGGYGAAPQQHQQHYRQPLQEGGESGRRVKDYTVSKRFTGNVEANIHGIRRSDSEKADGYRQQVAEHANRIYEDTKKFPSEADLNKFASSLFGYPVRAEVRFVDQPDRVVKEVHGVSPEKVPDHIRALFE